LIDVDTIDGPDFQVCLRQGVVYLAVRGIIRGLRDYPEDAARSAAAVDSLYIICKAEVYLKSAVESNGSTRPNDIYVTRFLAKLYMVGWPDRAHSDV
jgi:hypothetical protein